MTPTNQEISRKLRDQANTLAHTGDNLYRIRAYRQAALAVQGLPEEVSTIVASHGRQGLEELPGIGKSLAETIEEIVRAGVTSGPLAV